MIYKEEIVKDLKIKGYINKKINYQNFLELYAPYKNFYTEKEFAFVIGITQAAYKNMKNAGKNVIVLKTEKKEITLEEKEEIKKELKERGYSNYKIDYEEFKRLYEEYKDRVQNEREFASVLEISYSNYLHIKNEGKKAIILKTNNKTIKLEEKQEIIKQLKKEGFENKKANYYQFKELHNRFKEKVEDEKEFANIVGISDSSYYHMKNDNKSAIILKKYIKKTKKEIKRKVREELIKKGYRNKSIDYIEFKYLHNQYKKYVEDEIDFAEILRISYDNFMLMKHSNKRVIILKNIDKEIKYIVSNNMKWYSKEEIEGIAYQRERNIEDFLITVFGNDYKLYEETLLKNKKIYLGKGRVSNKFLEKYAKKILEISKEVSKEFADSSEIEDEIIMYVIENFLYVENNFKDEEQIEEILRKEIKRKARQIAINNYFQGKRVVSLDEGITFYKKGSIKQLTRQVVYRKIKFNKEIEIKEEKTNNNISDACIDKMKLYLEEGKEKKEIIELVSKEMKIDKNKMLEIVKKELIRRTQGITHIDNEEREAF